MATQTLKTQPTTTAQCQCPSCRGLECMERPRYFAGQLLTEAELNSEQAYVLAKNRLHNRYLHGWGVVCGLEVVCHDCEGWVKVKAGYALDPCGNDVIVCRDHDLNVLAEIQKCLDKKKRREDDCAPPRDTRDTCVDMDEHWCIALEYRENETRGVMPLQERATAHAGCGCGGGNTTVTPSPTRPSACEATRVLEQYRLTVIPEPPSCAISRSSTDAVVRLAAFPPAGSILAAILPERFHNHPLLRALVGAAPSESLFARALALLDGVEVFFAARFTVTERMQLMNIARACLMRDDNDAGWRSFDPGDPVVADTLCCRLRRAVRELYEQNPFNVRCQPFDCPPCEERNETPRWADQDVLNPNKVERFGPGGPSTTNNHFDNVMCCLVDALLNYLTDAACALLLPPCPPEPCDERVIIACVTINKNKIVRICNHSCRRYAGSFAAIEHWTSAVPIAALIRQVVTDICCAPLAASAIAGVRRRYRDGLPGTEPPVMGDPKAPDHGVPIDEQLPQT